jgi:hypothetical protein
VRTAQVPDTSVVVEYLHTYNGDFVDLLTVE